MPSEGLLRGAVRALTRKASRSLTPKKGQPNTHEDDHENYHPSEQDSGHLPVSRVPSATTASSDNGNSTRLSGKPSSTNLVDDVELAPSTSPGSAAQVTDTHILDIATASFPPVPEDANILPLPKPVLVPRLDPGGAIPFARMWAPELASHAITKEDFVAFVDNLNIIITPHVAFRVLQIASFAVGLVPYDMAEGIGGALEAIAIIGAIAMNYKRTKDYLAIMNEKYFHPRKLHIKRIGTKRLKKLFELDQKDPCLAPLTEDTLELTSQERCLRYLSQYSCELSSDVPAPSPATTMLAKVTTWQIKHKIRKADKSARSGRKRAWKRHQKGKKPLSSWDSRGERVRVRSLDWILVQNLEEWETQRAKKGEKKKKEGGKRHASVWRGIL
ncbi:hypothetical protein F5Y12DRAFT_169351 [Xylaria sp. FL1777]|nr:hypothetical protein F5Y12DRAFT_169351 [Xylaria sp. FL1777]